jgi:tetratricopeptide (TPR) repeat protein
VLVRLESRRGRFIALAVTLAAVTWLAKIIASPAVADHLARNAVTVPQLERAIGWDPTAPDLRMRLAHAYLARLGPDDVARSEAQLEAALHQRPTLGWTWLQLAILADRQGDTSRAQRALDTAIRLDRHNVWLRWEAALLALRLGERDAALEHLGYVLAVDPQQREAAFQVTRTLLQPGESLAGLLPAEPETLTGLLTSAVRHRDLALAEAAWERRAPLAPALPKDLQRGYLELLLGGGEGLAARRVWMALVPDGSAATAGDAIWDGGFEADSLPGWGFHWQVRRVWGVEVTLDRFVAARGGHSLRLAFNSFPTLDFAGVWQAVAVEPGREYALHALTKALEFNTHSGLKLQLVTSDGKRLLAETGTVAGTTPGWIPLETRVRIPNDVSLARILMRREKAPGPEGNLGGKVWIDDVSLTPLGAPSPSSATRSVPAAGKGRGAAAPAGPGAPPA